MARILELRCGSCRAVAFCVILFHGAEIDFRCKGCGQLNSVKIEAGLPEKPAPPEQTERKL